MSTEVYYQGDNQYEIDTRTDQIILFGPRPSTSKYVEEQQYDTADSIMTDTLEEKAIKCISDYAKVAIGRLSPSHHNKENIIYFFRWEDRTRKTSKVYPFIQVGLSKNGEIVSYVNTLNLTNDASKVNTYQQNAINPTTQIAVTAAPVGFYIYPNGGSYYQRFGPSQYWWKKSNEGYCGHKSTSGACTSSSLWYMEFTYESNYQSNYARWNNIRAAKTEELWVFIPQYNATSSWASYSIAYNGASSKNLRVNQYYYSDAWVPMGKYFDIMNVELSDKPYAWQTPNPTKRVGFDEIKILY